MSPTDPARIVTQPGEREAARMADLERRVRRQEVGRPAQGEWQTPVLEDGFTNRGDGYAPAGYYRDTSERVWLRGVVQTSTESFTDELLFRLAEGFRPIASHEFIAFRGPADIWALVSVAPDGAVTVSGAGVELVALDPVSFRTF